MSETKKYWACSVCDSGGHPLTVTHARDASQAHTERTGHFTIYGTMKDEA